MFKDYLNSDRVCKVENITKLIKLDNYFYNLSCEYLHIKSLKINIGFNLRIQIGLKLRYFIKDTPLPSIEVIFRWIIQNTSYLIILLNMLYA